jgi:uncharacterized membrane protein YeiH
MVHPEFQVPIALDYFATFLWALSGAAVGMHKRYDFAGVLVVALLSATGGGLIRDGIFLQQMPPVLGDVWYIPIIMLATVILGLFRKWITRMPIIDQLISVIDAVGIPAFAIVGMQLSMRAGIPLPGVVLIGVVNGFGGGILRDLIVGDTPAVLKPGHFAVTALFFVCLFFVGLIRWFGLNKELAAWGAIVLFFAVRMLSLRFDWQTRPILPDLPP